MSSWFRMRWTVARWEFRRYFKLKDQLIGLVCMLISGLVGYGAVRISTAAEKVQLAVLGVDSGFVFPEKGKLRRAEGQFTEEQWHARVESREVDGLLVISENPPGAGMAEKPWSARLVVRQEPAWLSELQTLLQGRRMQWEILSAGIAPETVAQILAPAVVDVVTLANRGVSKADRLIAYSILGATIVTSWIGLAYMMTGITGEKQQRVTEQVVSAIRPQTWIDGKLLGITLASVLSLGFLFLSGVVSMLAASLLGFEIPLPGSIRRWDFLPLLAFFYFGGVFFWNSFYATVSSIINDPNTSSRSGLLFLPMLPMFAAGLVISQPDGNMMKVLSLLPGTSSTAMPIRMVLSEVTIMETIFSMILLVAGIVLLRRLAGRIFAAGIMLYGKEPSWVDITRWALGRDSD